MFLSCPSVDLILLCIPSQIVYKVPTVGLPRGYNEKHSRDDSILQGVAMPGELADPSVELEDKPNHESFFIL